MHTQFSDCKEFQTDFPQLQYKATDLVREVIGNQMNLHACYRIIGATLAGLALVSEPAFCATPPLKIPNQAISNPVTVPPVSRPIGAAQILVTMASPVNVPKLEAVGPGRPILVVISSPVNLPAFQATGPGRPQSVAIVSPVNIPVMQAVGTAPFKLIGSNPHVAAVLQQGVAQPPQATASATSPQTKPQLSLTVATPIPLPTPVPLSKLPR